MSSARPTRPATARPRSWPRAGAAALGLVALALLWWGTHTSVTPKPSDLASDTILRDPAVLTSPSDGGLASPTRAQQPTLLASASPPPPPPTMLDALDSVAPALRRCSPLAGGLLLVEFTTLEKRDTFGSVAVSGTTHPDLDRCVREATADMHFQPRYAETFSKEYIP